MNFRACTLTAGYMQDRRNALLLLHFVVFIWGFTGILGKLIEQSTLHLVYTRTVIGMIGLVLAAWWMKQSISWRTPELKQYFLTGLLITGHWITFYGAIKISTASLAAACLSTSTVFTALLEPFWFKRKVRAYEVVLGLVVMEDHTRADAFGESEIRLLGTVAGMIETFQVIMEAGAGDPKLMAGGISKAMIATVLGLGIAIPLLFINAVLASRSRALIQILDEQSAGLLAERIEAQQTGALSRA